MLLTFAALGTTSEARTEVGAVDDFHEALLGLALAQRQPYGRCVRYHVAAHRLLGVADEHGAARWVAHHLRRSRQQGSGSSSGVSWSCRVT